MTGDIDLIDLDRFRLKKDLKKGVTIFEFHNGNDRWVPLTTQTGKVRDIVTESRRSSNTGCKDQANH